MDFKTWIKNYGSPGRLYDVATEADIAGDYFNGFEDFRIEKSYDVQDEQERFIVSWKNPSDPTGAPASGGDFSETLDIINVPGLKKKHIPWLLFGGAALALILIIYFIKRK